MKRAQAKQKLDAVFSAFAEAMAAYVFDSNLSVTAFRDACVPFSDRVKALKDFSDRHERKTGKAVYREMWSAVCAYDVRTSPPWSMPISSKGVKDEKLLAAIVENLNNQNLWLLVSAFEAYERFLKDFYGTLGYLDRNLWRCSDFGDTPLNELSNKGLSWYRQTVRETIAKRSVDQIQERLRRIFPVFAERETSPGFDLRMWVKVAGAFRHCIVHSQASKPEEEFIGELEKVSGRSLRPKTTGACDRAAVITRYLRIEDGSCHIEGIDRQWLTRGHAHLNMPTRNLMEMLSSHACLAYSAAMMHFGEKPSWDRHSEDSTDQPAEGP